jgi:hypothetical protein
MQVIGLFFRLKGGVGVEEGGVKSDGFVGDFGFHVSMLKVEKYVV